MYVNCIYSPDFNIYLLYYYIGMHLCTTFLECSAHFTCMSNMTLVAGVPTMGAPCWRLAIILVRIVIRMWS